MTNLIQLLSLLSNRFGLDDEWKTRGWQHAELANAVIMRPTILAELQAAADKYDDKAVMVYELETVDLQFPPMEVDIKSLPDLKGCLVWHFDLALVPKSRKWLAVHKNDQMMTTFHGPVDMVNRIHSIAYSLDIRGAG